MPGEAHRASGPGHSGARDVISLCVASSVRGASDGTPGLLLCCDVRPAPAQVQMAARACHTALVGCLSVRDLVPQGWLQ